MGYFYVVPTFGYILYGCFLCINRNVPIIGGYKNVSFRICLIEAIAKLVKINQIINTL